MKSKLFGCLSATVLGAAIAIATPALAQHAGGGMPGGRMFTGRSVFVPGGNRFAGAPFASRQAFVNRRFFDEGRRDRFEDRFEDRLRHRRFFVNRFNNFAFIGVPFAYDYADGCWRWDGWQWINICYDYGGYNNVY